MYTGDEISSYFPSDNAYGIHIKKFTKAVQRCSTLMQNNSALKLEDISYADALGENSYKDVKLVSILEAGGVHESAHHLFSQIKKREGREGVILDNAGKRDPSVIEDIRYLSSEKERRARIWEMAYARRYVPDWYPYIFKDYAAITSIISNVRADPNQKN